MTQEGFENSETTSAGAKPGLQPGDTETQPTTDASIQPEGGDYASSESANPESEFSSESEPSESPEGSEGSEGSEGQF